MNRMATIVIVVYIYDYLMYFNPNVIFFFIDLLKEFFYLLDTFLTGHSEINIKTIKPSFIIFLQKQILDICNLVLVNHSYSYLFTSIANRSKNTICILHKLQNEQYM